MRRHIPNLLSWTRVVFSPLFILLYSLTPQGYISAVTLLGLMLLSDALDGYLARRWGVASREGLLIDGLGDRALYICLTITFVAVGRISPTIAWLVIFREILMYINRLLSMETWFPVKSSDRRLTQLHAGAIRLWLFSFVFADGVHIFAAASKVDRFRHWEVIRSPLLALTLVVAYFSEARAISRRLKLHRPVVRLPHGPQIQDSYNSRAESKEVHER
jgi:cardiolipin synthase